MAVHREARSQPQRPNEAWSLDFIHDELCNSKKFRALTVVDIFTREGLAIEVGHRLRGEPYGTELPWLSGVRSCPM
jgi:putative transposase